MKPRDSFQNSFSLRSFVAKSTAGFRCAPNDKDQTRALLAASRDFHRKNAGAMGHKAAASGDNPPNRKTCLGVHRQGRIVHFLLHFKAPWCLPFFLRNRFVNVGRHS